MVAGAVGRKKAGGGDGRREVTMAVAGREVIFPEELPHWIGGKEVKGSSAMYSSKKFAATGEIVTQVPMAGSHDVDVAVKAATEGFRVWSSMTGEERGAILIKAASLIEDKHEELARLEVIDVGKPISEALSDTGGASILRLLSGQASTLCVRGTHTCNGSGGFSYTRREPLGVVAAVGAWNFPIQVSTLLVPLSPFLSIPSPPPFPFSLSPSIIHLLMAHLLYMPHLTQSPLTISSTSPLFLSALLRTQIALWKISPALACGNSVILKPSEHSPITAHRIAGLFRDAGLPPGVLSVVHGGRETGSLLASHKGIAKVSVTGSVETGRKVMEACAGTLKRISVEAGGKSPLIILPDADVDSAVTGAMAANWLNAGQVCCNGTRVYVHEDILPAFLERLVARTRAIRIGDPREAGTQMGPLVTAEHAAMVRARIAEAASSGGELVYDGSVVSLGEGSRLDAGCFVGPVIMLGRRDSSRLVREEIFGPVMAVLPYSSEQEVIERANDTHFGLAAGVFTKDLEGAHRVAAALQTGAI